MRQYAWRRGVGQRRQCSSRHTRAQRLALGKERGGGGGGGWPAIMMARQLSSPPFSQSEESGGAAEDRPATARQLSSTSNPARSVAARSRPATAQQLSTPLVSPEVALGRKTARVARRRQGSSCHRDPVPAPCKERGGGGSASDGKAALITLAPILGRDRDDRGRQATARQLSSSQRPHLLWSVPAGGWPVTVRQFSSPSLLNPARGAAA